MAAASGPDPAPAIRAGVITGTVITQVPAPPPLRASIDPEVCGESLPDESLVVTDGRVAHTVVTVAGVRAEAPAEVVITNEKCRFMPRVARLRPKGAIKMTSRDPVLHTMHAAAGGERAFFNVSLPIPGLTLSRSIDERGIVHLSCSTHTWMRGYLHLTDELSAVSGVDGQFRLEGVPAGRQVLRIWHETLRSPDVTVNVDEGQTVAVEITLTK